MLAKGMFGHKNALCPQSQKYTFPYLTPTIFFSFAHVGAELAHLGRDPDPGSERRVQYSIFLRPMMERSFKDGRVVQGCERSFKDQTVVQGWKGCSKKKDGRVVQRWKVRSRVKGRSRIKRSFKDGRVIQAWK